MAAALSDADWERLRVAAVEAMDKAAKILSEASDRARATIKTMI